MGKKMLGPYSPKFRMSREEFKKKYGSFNDAPPNFKEISESEFAQSMFWTYSPDYTDHRQITDFEKQCLSVKLYWFYDGNGFGMARDYYGGKVRYFRFYACEHNFRELSVSESREKGLPHFGNCYHVMECRKCGFIQSYDSSG